MCWESLCVSSVSVPRPLQFADPPLNTEKTLLFKTDASQQSRPFENRSKPRTRNTTTPCDSSVISATSCSKLTYLNSRYSLRTGASRGRRESQRPAIPLLSLLPPVQNRRISTVDIVWEQEQAEDAENHNALRSSVISATSCSKLTYLDSRGRSRTGASRGRGESQHSAIPLLSLLPPVQN